jgi:hypothetical protein
MVDFISVSFLSVKTKLFSINFDKVKELCQSSKLLKINYLHAFLLSF